MNVFHDFLFYPQIVPMEREVTEFIQFEKRIELIEWNESEFKQFDDKGKEYL